VVRFSALRLPSFKGGVFFDWLFLGLVFRLGFSGVSKGRVRRGIATAPSLVTTGLDVEPGGDE
jgi:hypothetical protein